MKVLILNGSPRKGGNTELLLEELGRGLREAGCDFRLIDLPSLQIHPCINCGHCEQHGQCIFKDDMEELYHLIPQCRRIIIGSPVYFYGVTAQAKAFIDRCQVLWSRKYLLGTPKGTEEHRGYLVSVAGTSGKKVFDGVRLTARYALDAMGCSYCDELLVRDVDQLGAILKHPEELERARELGRTICQPAPNS
ncbi:flavodoxin family protein [Desulfogranum mediterraneum]|uniref:flavodoxin family protein n=1 Tax=Desulfogranum mediterraneum TaxID=160661 RepID=UPI00040E6D12|nr:flavodoxin family protein [Desulfogranum mediterraneum]